MSQAIGILELTSIAKGMELGDAMLKSANVNLLVSKTICPGKFFADARRRYRRYPAGH